MRPEDCIPSTGQPLSGLLIRSQRYRDSPTMSPTSAGHMTRSSCSMILVSTCIRNRIYWYAYVNGVYKDGYGNHANGLNVIELSNNDQVNFYYAPNKDPNPVVNATAVVKIKVNIQAPGPVVDTLYDGTVTLTPGETFTKTGIQQCHRRLYTINRTTPLGALDKVATSQGFTYNVTDKRWSYDQVLLLDDIGQYLNKKPNILVCLCQWCVQGRLSATMPTG